MDELRRIDLNLLYLLDTLYHERSVSRTAHRLGLTQSAISQGLARLRFTLGDQLLVWNGRVMQPTAKCTQLAPKLRAIMSQIRDALRSDNFLPSELNRDYVVATADYVGLFIGQSLLKSLAAEAPNVSVYFIDVKRPMVEGHAPLEYEMFILPKGPLNVVGLSSAPLWSDRYVGVVAASNTEIDDTLSAEALSSLPNIGYTLDPRILYSPEIKFMAERGITAHYSLLTSSYMMLPFLLRETNAVAIVQENLANLFIDLADIRIVELPFEIPPLEMMLYWHPTFDDDEGHEWLRAKIIAAAGELSRNGSRPNPTP